MVAHFSATAARGVWRPGGGPVWWKSATKAEGEAENGSMTVMVVMVVVVVLVAPVKVGMGIGMSFLHCQNLLVRALSLFLLNVE